MLINIRIALRKPRQEGEFLSGRGGRLVEADAGYVSGLDDVGVVVVLF